MPIEREKIREIMAEAKITGGSFTSIDKKGEIYTTPLGVSGCDLYKMDDACLTVAQSRFDSSRLD